MYNVLKYILSIDFFILPILIEYISYNTLTLKWNEHITRTHKKNKKCDHCKNENRLIFNKR